MPRARGGRGRGTGRRRAVTPVADGRSERQAAFEARKARLLEKALDLSEVEEAAVAVVCSGIDGPGGAEYWPSVEAARAVAELFHDLPEEMRRGELRAHASYASYQRRKLAEVQEGGIVAALGPWESALDGMAMKALGELLASIEVSQKATRSRIRELQPQPEESAAENSVAGQEAAAPASGEVQGKLKQLPRDDDEVQGTQNQSPGDDDGDGAAWMERLVEELEENLMAGEEDASGEVRGAQNQPQDADEVQGAQNQPPGDNDDGEASWMEQLVEELEENLMAGEEDAIGEAQGAQNQPQDADEVQEAQNQPPGDDDDDAAWMEQMVEDLREQPEPANAAPYQPAPHEYIDVGGGYMMERDAYDYMQYDLTMFTPYYGLPLRLWPWGAPPPPQ